VKAQKIETAAERIRSLLTDSLHGRTGPELHPLTGRKTALRAAIAEIIRAELGTDKTAVNGAGGFWVWEAHAEPAAAALEVDPAQLPLFSEAAK
jgi:hypothetical protein